MEEIEDINAGQIVQDYLASTEGDERYDKGVTIIIDLCEHINLLNDQLRNIKKTLSWGEIKKQFFETRDLLEKLTIIENFIADHKIYVENIYNDSYNMPQKEGVDQFSPNLTQNNQKVNDKIQNLFHKIMKMNKSIVSLECTNLEGAKDLYDDRSTKYKDFNQDYDEIVLSLVSIFSEVYEIHTILRAKKQEKIEAHERSKDKLATMGKYGIPYQKQVAKDVDAEYDEDEMMLMPDDKKFKKPLWPDQSPKTKTQKKKNHARNS